MLDDKAIRDMMSSGVFRRGLDQISRGIGGPDDKRPCLGFLTHVGCPRSGGGCKMRHVTKGPPATLRALGAAAQLLAAQRGGWADEKRLTAHQMRDMWQTFSAKSGELGPEVGTTTAAAQW